MLQINTTKQFERDVKKVSRQNKNVKKLKMIIVALACSEKLTANHRDHALKGEYLGCRECHVEPDWLLIYAKTPNEIILYRTGTHSELF
jgi:mRNA interferase YafQ